MESFLYVNKGKNRHLYPFSLEILNQHVYEFSQNVTWWYNKELTKFDNSMKTLATQHGLFSTEISHADCEPLHADLDDWITKTKKGVAFSLVNSSE